MSWIFESDDIWDIDRKLLGLKKPSAQELVSIRLYSFPFIFP